MRPHQVAFYRTVKALFWPVTRLYVRLTILGAGRIPRRGGCLIVANHASYADAIVLGSACPRRIVFLITAPIYRLLRLRWFYYMMGSMPVAPDVPDPGAIKRALRALRQGQVVGIFPEGQRMPDGSLGQAKAGAALLAARSGVPVIPAALVGTHKVMPVGAVIPRPLPVTVLFGEPLLFPGEQARRPSRQHLDQFADRLMASIASLIESAASRPPVVRSGVRERLP